jgi:hypothetical protein
MDRDTMTPDMKEVYRHNKAKKVGGDQGSHIIYHIHIPGKHRGLHQGYIGRSSLSLEGTHKRYKQELREIEEGTRKARWVHKLLRRYGKECVINLVSSGLTLEESKYWEAQYRPEDMPSSSFNWNSCAGG